MDAREVINLIQNEQIQAVDLRFCDLPGLWQHFTISAGDLDEDSFVEGFGFDGSSIRGFQQIQESDMILIPDPSTCFEDPFSKVRTLILICNIADPITQEPYSRDPRYITQKAEKYLVSTGIGDTAYFGPEPEFFVLDDVRFDQSYNHGYYYVDSVEGFWNSGREENPNLGYKPRYKEGYFPVPPMDTLQDMRTEMMLALQDAGIQVEVHHHEVATAGQCEIDMRFDSLVNMGDKLLKFKYIIKNVARRYDKTVTLMPKPIFMDNGSGMHVHQSLWKNGRNVFYGPGTYADLSQEAVYYIGGLLKHAAAVLAFGAPTTNSYRRLVPGYEAPVNLIYSMRNRSACVRIPTYSSSEKAKRVEFRPPDPSANG
ncbi:MAG: type I glutamate--ammonia ligase, partial [Candidatus Aminicenantes bacterium]|nr:type I glutamate--ammonia ligase [Candidatus Aminicenantes bacterium]